MRDLMKNNDLVELSFEQINDDRDKMEYAFKFRYEIFCEEKRFLNKDNFCKPIETDLFDDSSLHFAAFDQFGNIKGYARLVLHSENGYPMQRLCPYEITGAIDYIGKNSAEISRLAVAKNLRSFCQKSHVGNTAPKIQLGLYQMMYATCLQLDITHVFAIMEQSLYKSLSRFSLKFRPIGDGFEDHGTVFPFLGNVSALGKHVG